MILPDLAFASAPQHLGGLHPYESALVLLVAFGPFVVIALLARRERRRAADDQRTDEDAGGGVVRRPGD